MKSAWMERATTAAITLGQKAQNKIQEVHRKQGTAMIHGRISDTNSKSNMRTTTPHSKYNMKCNTKQIH